MAQARVPERSPHVADASSSHGAAGQVVPHPARRPSLGRLMVGVDGTPASRQAVDWAVNLAESHDASVLVCQVVPDVTTVAGAETVGWASLRRAMASAREGATLATADARARLERAGVEADVEILEGSPVRRLADLADERAIDLLLLGSHGHGRLHRWVLGSVSQAVRHRVAASVLLTKAAPPPRRILLATDGEDPARRAMTHAASLADTWEAELGVLHVVQAPVYDLEASLDRIEAAYTAGGPLSRRPEPDVVVEIGDPGDRIPEAAAAWGADLLVTGSRDLHGLASLLKGSVSDRVANQAACSVLVVKGPSSG